MSAPRPLAAIVGNAIYLDAFVAAIFATALDGPVIDPRFTTQETAIAAIEAMAMEEYQRPLTYRDRLHLGMETVMEWNRRAAAQAEERRSRGEWLEDHQAGARR